MFEAREYIRWRIKAHGKAGVHPPFLFRLADEVLTEKNTVSMAPHIETMRKKLRKDRRVIQVTDLGAGSKTGAARERSIRDMARHAAKSEKWGKTLARLAAELQPNHLIELGTSLGISAAYLASAVPKGKLVTLEGCPAIASEARKNLDSLEIKNVEIRTGHFDQTLPALLGELNSVDFAYVDGNHTEEATLRYFDWLKNKAQGHTVLVFDDIHWSSGMAEAWKKITADSRVTLSVDFFRIGVVFFDSRFSKQHFNLVI
jgi:predicted O-methyltransferase YrrM